MNLDLLFAVGTAIAVLGSAIAAFTGDPSSARRIYWLSWFVGGVVAALAVLDRGPLAVPQARAAVPCWPGCSPTFARPT
jgi:hypothetical protein